MDLWERGRTAKSEIGGGGMDRSEARTLSGAVSGGIESGLGFNKSLRLQDHHCLVLMTPPPSAPLLLCQVARHACQPSSFTHPPKKHLLNAY